MLGIPLNLAEMPDKETAKNPCNTWQDHWLDRIKGLNMTKSVIFKPFLVYQPLQMLVRRLFALPDNPSGLVEP